MGLPLALRTGALALALSALGAGLAAACSRPQPPGVRVRVSRAAVAVLRGESKMPLVLHLRGVHGGGIVDVFVDDGSGRPFARDDDPRLVTYFAGEGGDRTFGTSAVVTNVGPVRDAFQRSARLTLRLIGPRGEVAVESASLDAGR